MSSFSNLVKSVMDKSYEINLETSGSGYALRVFGKFGEWVSIKDYDYRFIVRSSLTDTAYAVPVDEEKLLGWDGEVPLMFLFPNPSDLFDFNGIINIVLKMELKSFDVDFESKILSLTTSKGQDFKLKFKQE